MNIDISYSDIVRYAKAYFNYLIDSSHAESNESNFSEKYHTLLEERARIGKDLAMAIETDINYTIEANMDIIVNDNGEIDYKFAKKIYFAKLKKDVLKTTKTNGRQPK